MFNIKNEKQLFIDDLLIEEHQGLSFTVNRPVKTYNKILTATQPWESWMIGPWCTIIEDDGIYQMWYESYFMDENNKRTGRLCYAESEDGLNWKKPVLNLVPFDGSTANNIVYPLQGNFYHGGTVFKDPVGKPQERYKIIYLIEGKGFDCVCGAFSPDGLRWKTYQSNPLLRIRSDTQNVCFWDDRLAKYVCFVRLNMPLHDPNIIRTIGRSETENFEDWPDADPILCFNDQDPPDVDLYNSAAFKYPYAPEAYFMFTSLFHHKADTLDVQLAVSRDGISWKRPDRKPFLPLGAEGTFDSKMIHTCVGQIRKGDEYWIFYRGTDRKHSEHVTNMSYGGIISKAVLRLDGFMSLDAQDQGYFLTKPIVFEGTKLELNYQTAGDGHITVGLCDERGEPFNGYASAECNLIKGDKTAAAVSWGGKNDVSKLSSRVVRVRFIFNKSKLYSFKFSS
ncbi:MAG: hypothetical protein ABIG61_15570 [Planctomycetota bacterium]